MASPNHDQVTMPIIMAKQGHLYVIGMLHRPGIASFMYYLEHQYFPPAEVTLNDLYQLYHTDYQTVTYLIAEIPAKGAVTSSQLHQLAANYGLRLVNGKPFDGQSEFPIECTADACFTLETADHGLFRQQLVEAGSIDALLMAEYHALPRGASLSSM
jgi:hypothetical protein